MKTLGVSHVGIHAKDPARLSFDDLREVRDLRRTSIKGTGLMMEQAPAQAAE